AVPHPGRGHAQLRRSRDPATDAKLGEHALPEPRLPAHAAVAGHPAGPGAHHRRARRQPAWRWAARLARPAAARPHRMTRELPMRLEMATYTVRDVQLGGPTRLSNGTLHVDSDELRRLVLEGGDFADCAVDVVRPGDEVRLIHVMDAVEPRYKPGDVSAFPGFLGLPRTAGEGRTHRLGGMAVVSVGEAVAGEPTYWREAVI